MLANRQFIISLLISIVFHGLLLVSVQFLGKDFPDKEKLTPIEVTYIAQLLKRIPVKTSLEDIAKPEPKQELSQVQTEELVPQEEDLNIDEAPPYQELSEPEPRPKETSPPLEKEEQIKTPEKTPAKEEIAVVENIENGVQIPPEDPEIVKQPAYQNYYRTIREKIKLFANSNRPYLRRNGEIYLTFIVSKTGVLKRVKISDEKSSNIRILREAGIKAVEDASPFPPFPEELKASNLSFSIIISYKLGRG